MMGYMDGGALPFDINDFATTSPKINDSSHIQSMLTDSYTPIPQPVPPVSSSTSMPSNYMSYDYSSQMSTSYDQYGQALSYNNAAGSAQPPNMFPYGQSQPQPPNSFSNQSGSYMQRPPPPMPAFDNSNVDVSVSDEYNPDTWELDWNTTQESSFNTSLDAPHSPPNYERKGVNTNVIEYIEPNDNHIPGAGDVDHRQLILPMNGLSAIGAKDRNRLVDVDHRNLISLTGSPKLNDKDAGSQSLIGSKDMDFRQMMTENIPNAPPPPHISADGKLAPPPSPPVMLLAQSSSIDSDAGNLMSPPSFLPPKFQSPPSQKPKNERGTRTYFQTNSYPLTHFYFILFFCLFFFIIKFRFAQNCI